jgi:predicted branched-subunit amino acid permease
MAAKDTRLEESDKAYAHWFLRGARLAFSIPGLILASTFVGFTTLAKAAGFSLVETVFMTGIVWALPAKVVLVGAVQAGASLPAVFIAVALSSMRLMPMVVALIPELRAPRTRRWVLYALSHFVAVTSWVIAMERLRGVPRDMRTAWYAGVGGTLVLSNMVVVAATYVVVDGVPGWVSAALLLLTPIYFLTSLWGSARERASHVAMVLGLILGPALHTMLPGFDLLVAGLVGGPVAFLFHKLSKGKRAA